MKIGHTSSVLAAAAMAATVAVAAKPVRTPAAADVGVALCDFLAELLDDFSGLDFALLLDDFSGVPRGVSSDVSHTSGSESSLGPVREEFSAVVRDDSALVSRALPSGVSGDSPVVSRLLSIEASFVLFFEVSRPLFFDLLLDLLLEVVSESVSALGRADVSWFVLESPTSEIASNSLSADVAVSELTFSRSVSNSAGV